MLTINEESSDVLWKIGDVALYLAVSSKTVEKQRSTGDLPPAIVFGRNVRWIPDQIRLWALEHQEVPANGREFA